MRSGLLTFPQLSTGPETSNSSLDLSSALKLQILGGDVFEILWYIKMLLFFSYQRHRSIREKGKELI